MRTRDRRPAGAATRAALAAATAAALAAVLVALPAPRASAADEAITGRVVHGTDGGAVPDVQVTLHTFEDGVEAPATSDTTDRSGRFAFSTLVAGATRTYQVSVRFAQVVYRSRVVQLGEGETVDLALKVYDRTTSTDRLAVADWVVWIDREPDGRVAVQQDLRIRNDGGATYVGTQPVDDGQQVTLRLPIVPGARDFQYLGRFIECCAGVRGGAFVHTLPIEPGTSDGTMRYTAPPPDDLTFEMALPTESFSLLVPADLAIETDGLTAAGELPEGGITYRIYSASGLAVGERVRVTLTGLGADTPRTILVVGLGLLVVVLLGGGSMWWLRGRRPAPAKRPARRGHGRGPRAAGNGHGRAGRGERRPRERPVRSPAAERGGLSERESLLIDEILALDVAHERGLLERDTYRKLRAAAKDRLLELRDGMVKEARHGREG